MGAWVRHGATKYFHLLFNLCDLWKIPSTHPVYAEEGVQRTLIEPGGSAAVQLQMLAQVLSTIQPWTKSDRAIKRYFRRLQFYHNYNVGSVGQAYTENTAVEHFNY
jgi:hypothetical protein